MISKFLSKFIISTSISVFILMMFFLANTSLVRAASEDISVTETVTGQAPIINNNDISVTDITASGAKISFSTDIASLCTIYYGTSVSYDQSKKDDNYIDHHFFELTQLSSGTVYHFKISCVSQHGLSTETEDQTFETQQPTLPVPAGLVTFWDQIKDFVRAVAESPIAKAIYTPLNAVVTTAVLMSILLPSLLNLPLLSLWDSISVWLFSLVGLVRIKKKWGIVYDSESDQPIPLAAVRIFDFEYKKLLATQLTDKDGRFGFLIKPGQYYLNIIKHDYQFPSKFAASNYHGEPFQVKEDGVISFNIPLDPDLHKLTRKMNIITATTKVLDRIKFPLLTIGTVLSMIFFVHDPSVINTAIIVVYGIIWSLEIYQILRPHTFGNVFEVTDKDPLDLAIVRVFDKKTGKLINTNVSDSHGHYFSLISTGDYQIKATKENFQKSEIKDVHYKRGDVLTKDIYLKKVT